MKKTLIAVGMSLLLLCSSCQHKSSDAANVENRQAKTRVLIEYLDSTVNVSRQPLGVRISRVGMHVVVVSRKKNVEFILQGKGAEASFKLYSDHSFALRLDGVHLYNPEGPAINIQSRQHGLILLSPESENILQDGALYALPQVGEQMNACFYSEGNLIFYGSGKLLLKGNFKHALYCRGYLKVTEKCDLSVTQAKKDGFHVLGEVMIEGGKLNINASDDGLKSSRNIVVNGGDIVIRTVKKDGSEGLECYQLMVNGGRMRILAYDDAINTARDLSIHGGSLYCYSLFNDGIDSNGSIHIDGGLVVSSGTQMPEEGIDCDRNTFVISGGIIIASGGGTSIPTSRLSTQASLIYSGDFDRNIHILGPEGEDILTYALTRNYNQYTLLFSSPTLKSGQTYALYSGGELEDGSQVYGYYTGATFSKGIKKADFTISSMVTVVGELRMGGPMNRGAFAPGKKRESPEHSDELFDPEGPQGTLYNREVTEIPDWPDML